MDGSITVVTAIQFTSWDIEQFFFFLRSLWLYQDNVEFGYYLSHQEKELC